jgi:uncharacterized protein YfdQ (DUF2303 family)
MNSEEKNKRDYEYQKKYLKRITVWYNTKREDDMELIHWLEQFAGDVSSKSEAVKECIYRCMKADPVYQAEHRKANGKEAK